MEIKIENHAGDEYNVSLYYTHSFEGKGGYMIRCKVEVEGLFSEIHTTTVSHYSTNSDAIDRINGRRADDDTTDDIQGQYHSDFFRNIAANIIRFTYEVEENA